MQPPTGWRLSLLFFSLLSAFCFLFSTLHAAGIKTSGSIQITDDIFGISGSALNSSGGIYSVQGFIGNLASGQSQGAPNIIEAGFYSKLVSSPSVYSFNNVTSGSFNNAWTASNPDETEYQIFLSTNDIIEDYFMLYKTTESSKSLEGLSANTSYYAFIYSNYMDSDISPAVSTVAVTLSAPVSSDTFIIRDTGFKSAELLFSSFENPGPSKYNSWQVFGAGLPQALYGHSSIAYDGYAYVSGGFNGVNFSSVVYQSQIDASGNLGAWTLAGYMAEARYGHKMLAAKGRLYAIGGYNAGGNQNSVYSVAISSLGGLGQWSAETNLIEATYFHSAFQYEGKIYVSGGYSSSVSAGVYKADILDDGTLGAWTVLTNMPDARYAHTMNVIGDYIYVIGGKDGANAKDNVWRTQIQENGTISAWSGVSSLPSTR
ncbi:MAG: hypothetical protein KAI33_07950, partial [Elusimicrobiales bacterium]|nr:hypothetical protein [Elusimicrobiales bacterium]